jgi:hypothetical protein
VNIETSATQPIVPAVSLKAIENRAAEMAPILGVNLDRAILSLILAHHKHGIPMIRPPVPTLHQERRPQE